MNGDHDSAPVSVDEKSNGAGSGQLSSAGKVDGDNMMTADEFFYQLNLSKLSDSHKIQQSNDRASVIRKNPMTRYAHQALINSRKRKRHDEDVFASNAISQEDKRQPTKLRKIKAKSKVGRCPPVLQKNGSDSASVLESSQLDILQNSEPEGKELVCTVCTFETTSEHEYKDHLESIKHRVRVEVEKGIDQKVFAMQKQWRANLQLPYKCYINSCTGQFIEWRGVFRHLHEHSNTFPFTCTRCESKFRDRSDVAKHIKRHLGIKKSKCEHCDKSFEKKESLVTHLVIVHGKDDPRPRNFKCTECGDAFLSKRAVDRHVRSHTGYRPEICQLCGASFHTQYDLKDHARVHTGEKPHKCVECDFNARTIQLLKKHQKRHLTDKPFACKECKFTCTNSGSLKRHSYLHSGKKPFKCPYCEHRCNSFDNLKKHIKKNKNHRGLKIYPCARCRIFSTDDGNAYLRHMKQYHFPHLDLKSSTATKLSGILIEEVQPQDDSETEDDITTVSGNNLFENDSETLLRDSDIPHDSLPLSGIQHSSNVLPELGLRSTMETLNESDLRRLDTNIPNSVNRYDKGDFLLSSVASHDNNPTRKAGNFSSAPFDEESLVRPFTSTTDGASTSSYTNQQGSRNISEHTELQDNTHSGIDMNQGYVAVLVKWPSDQKVEVQQGTAEGGGTPLTLIVNSNPVFLRTAETEQSPQTNSKATQSREHSNSASKTYIMSPNGLILAKEKHESTKSKTSQEQKNKSHEVCS